MDQTKLEEQIEGLAALSDPTRRRLYFFWSDPSIAPDRTVRQQRIRVTHPFHPLAGREFDPVVRKHTWAEDRVFFVDDNGQLISLPARWTDVDHAFVVIAAGRSALRVEELLALASLVECLRSQRPGEGNHSGTPSSGRNSRGTRVNPPLSARSLVERGCIRSGAGAARS